MHLPWLAMRMGCVSLLVPLVEKMHGFVRLLEPDSMSCECTRRTHRLPCWHDRLAVHASSARPDVNILLPELHGCILCTIQFKGF